MSETEKIVREELSDLLKIDAMNMSETDDLTKVAEWDSLCVLELLELIEERFGVLILPEKLVNMRTIKDVVSAIKENS